MLMVLFRREFSFVDALYLWEVKETPKYGSFSVLFLEYENIMYFSVNCKIRLCGPWSIIQTCLLNIPLMDLMKL